MKRHDFAIIIAVALLGLDALLWQRVFVGTPKPGFYFLDVGQGDATLILFPGGAKVLVDAGPDGRVVRSLEEILPTNDRSIDLALITHPQLDHFGGFSNLLDRYSFGAFLVNGRAADDGSPSGNWASLLKNIRSRNIPIVVLGAGDRIRTGSGGMQILSPDENFIQSAELNDTAIVALADTGGLSAFLTADIGFSVEEYLLTAHRGLVADLLKVGHHGSKYSSGDAFLAAIRPKAAVISVGSENRYGHPAKETMLRLQEAGARIFRTDQNGTVSAGLGPDKSRLLISAEE